MSRRRDPNPDVDELHRYNYPNWRPPPPPPVGGPFQRPVVLEDQPKSSFCAVMLVIFAISVTVGFSLGWFTP